MRRSRSNRREVLRRRAPLDDGQRRYSGSVGMRRRFALRLGAAGYQELGELFEVIGAGAVEFQFF